MLAQVCKDWMYIAKFLRKSISKIYNICAFYCPLKQRIFCHYFIYNEQKQFGKREFLPLFSSKHL